MQESMKTELVRAQRESAERKRVSQNCTDQTAIHVHQSKTAIERSMDLIGEVEKLLKGPLAG